MNETQALKQLDREAEPAHVAAAGSAHDVTAWVLADIRGGAWRRDGRRVWQFAAAAACVAAAASVGAAFVWCGGMNNPLASMGLQAFAMVESPTSGLF